MRVHIEFDRLGRDHMPEPLNAEVPDTDDGGVDLLGIRNVVFDHARKFLMSQDVDCYAERRTNPDGSPLPGNEFKGAVYVRGLPCVAGTFHGWEVREP